MGFQTKWVGGWVGVGPAKKMPPREPLSESLIPSPGVRRAMSQSGWPKAFGWFWWVGGGGGVGHGWGFKKVGRWVSAREEMPLIKRIYGLTLGCFEVLEIICCFAGTPDGLKEKPAPKGWNPWHPCHSGMDFFWKC